LPRGRFTRATSRKLTISTVTFEGLVFLAGVTARTPEGDIESQTRKVLEKIESLLAQAGSDKHHLLNANVWLSDMALFARMNAVWDAWVSPTPPARATVEARLGAPDLLIEISIVAAKVSR